MTDLRVRAPKSITIENDNHPLAIIEVRRGNKAPAQPVVKSPGAASRLLSGTTLQRGITVTVH